MKISPSGSWRTRREDLQYMIWVPLDCEVPTRDSSSKPLGFSVGMTYFNVIISLTFTSKNPLSNGGVLVNYLLSCLSLISFKPL